MAVNNVNLRPIAYSFLCFIAFVVFVVMWIPLWVLFLFLTIFFLVRAFAGGAIVAAKGESIKAIGVMGWYPVDGADEDLLYGLYIELGGYAVFVDVKCDDLKDQRMSYAKYLYESRDEAEGSLQEFLKRNVEFSGRNIEIIGLHSRDPRQGEVFWQPEGYTLIKGLNFLDP